MCIRDRRLTVYFTRFYQGVIYYLCRFRVIACLLLLLGFGLPVFMLPEKMEGDGKWVEYYNIYAEKCVAALSRITGLDFKLSGDLVGATSDTSCLVGYASAMKRRCV